ncbi:SUMF1/EgtB/PvdO family nonheme iron enzyme [Spirosoma litoris]
MKPFLATFLIVLLLQQAVAQPKMGIGPIFKNNQEGKRRALVLANQNYQHQAPLKNTLRDADSMAVALRYLGFEVMLVKDKTLAQTKDAIDQFTDSLKPGDVAFVYFSGHGLGYLRDNYLLPIEFAMETVGGIKNRAISTTELRDGITRRGVRNLFLVVDACRNELAAKGDGAFKLVAPEDNPPGTLMAFATDYGQTATYKSKDNRNSLYTESLLIYLRQPLEVQEIFRKANQRTNSESQRLGQPTQYPHYIPMIYDDYFFIKPIVPVSSASAPAGSDMVFIKGGTYKTDGGTTITVSSFLMGKYEVTIGEFEQFIHDTHYQTDGYTSENNFFWNGKKWVRANSKTVNWRFDEQGQPRPPSAYRYPVIYVSHNDAEAYCGWLSKKTGKKYRLPTEAEWEYAAGGGSTHSKYSWGDELPSGKLVGNIADETAQKTFLDWDVLQGYTDGFAFAAPVGSFAPNPLGLYDMTGNVLEWCSKQVQTNGSITSSNGDDNDMKPAFKGGAWNSEIEECSVSFSERRAPSFQSHYVGFRVVAQVD